MSHNTEVEGNAVPAADRNGWSAFLKSLASFSGDLSSMTAPPFILSPVSLTEFPAYWCEHPDLFAAIADGKSEEERALAVLRWFISTLKGQYKSRNDSVGSEKKPLNPVLGELFYGHWPDKAGRGRTDLLVEQVSHHPPITAYYIANESKKLALQGHNAQKTSFSVASASIIVKQIGHATLTLTLPSGAKEQYLLTLPRLVIAGVITGSPYIELSESSYIASSSGWLTTITYSGRGWVSGKARTFKATVTRPLIANHVIHTIEGQWDAIAKDKRTNAEFTNALSSPKEEVTVLPVEEQKDDFESRKLWKVVAKGIREGDFDTAGKAKGKIEDEQRQRRKDEVTKGEKWQLKHFIHVESDPDYERLAKVINAHQKTDLHPKTEDAYVFQHNAPSSV